MANEELFETLADLNLEGVSLGDEGRIICEPPRCQVVEGSSQELQPSARDLDLTLIAPPATRLEDAVHLTR